MHGADAAPFQALKTKMEEEWTPQMIDVLCIDTASLPIIWDADFLYGPRTASGKDSYVLCEINVSSCFAVPDQAPAAIARSVLKRLSDTELDRNTSDPAAGPNKPRPIHNAADLANDE